MLTWPDEKTTGKRRRGRLPFKSGEKIRNKKNSKAKIRGIEAEV